MFDGIFSPEKLLIVLAIALVIFGPKRLPEIGRGLGKGIREFKGSVNEAISETSDDSQKKESEAKSEKTA